MATASLVHPKRGNKSLTKYNPDTGVKTIRFLEAAEKHYAKAKDITKLDLAIRSKLEAQAEFVFWWDTHAEKFKGGNQRNRSATLVQAGEGGLPDRTTIHRWRRKLNSLWLNPLRSRRRWQ